MDKQSSDLLDADSGDSPGCSPCCGLCGPGRSAMGKEKQEHLLRKDQVCVLEAP